jgi:hypothetical protein
VFYVVLRCQARMCLQCVVCCCSGRSLLSLLLLLPCLHGSWLRHGFGIHCTAVGVLDVCSDVCSYDSELSGWLHREGWVPFCCQPAPTDSLLRTMLTMLKECCAALVMVVVYQALVSMAHTLSVLISVVWHGVLFFWRAGWVAAACVHVSHSLAAQDCSSCQNGSKLTYSCGSYVEPGCSCMSPCADCGAGMELG